MRTFDGITYYIEEFHKKEKDNLEKQRIEIKKEVYKPLEPYIGKKIKKEYATDLLFSCIDIAVNKLKIICSKYSIDTLLSITRRIPLKYLSSIESNNYSTLAIIKWANLEEDTTISHFENNKFYVEFIISEQILFDCFKILFLTGIISHIIVTNRWMGKGAKLVITNKCIPNFKANPEVTYAVNMYENRRLKDFILEGEGTPVKLYNLKNQDFIVTLVHLPKPLPILFRKNNFTVFLMNYFLGFIDAKDLYHTLMSYEREIEDKFGLGSDSIIQVFYSLSQHILKTIPWNLFDFSDFPKNLQCEYDMFNESIYFFFMFCQRGHIRYSENYFRKRLPEYVYLPVAESQDKARQLVNIFFDTFSIKENDRDKIDILGFAGNPIIFTSPAGNCYIDYTMMNNFLRNIIVEAKEWSSTQHGDKFNLIAKNFVTEKAKKTEVLGHKKEFRSGSGEIVVVDLILKNKNILYLVECKAYAKSREFLIGNYQAINQRNSKINKWVQQAKKTVNVVKECIDKKIVNLPVVDKVDWIVCTSTQEFLKPFDKFGLLTHDIPKVCTMEELIKFLNMD